MIIRIQMFLSVFPKVVTCYVSQNMSFLLLVLLVLKQWFINSASRNIVNYLRNLKIMVFYKNLSIKEGSH